MKCQILFFRKIIKTMSSVTILHSLFSGKNKKKYYKMTSAEIFTQNAERKKKILGSKHCIVCKCNIFSNITNSI